MKFILAILVLLSYVLSQPQKARPMLAENNLREIKKSILKCVSQNEKASPELKNYALENLNKDYKETLILSNYMQNEADRLIIRQCRRKSYLVDAQKSRLPFINKEKN